MEDRVPRNPGRVRLEPVTGQANVYDMTREDSPVVVGTALNKASLLTDETASFLGLDPAQNPTVNDAFVASVLAAKNVCLVKVTVTVNGRAAKAGVIINGLTSLDGGACLTGADGIATGITATASTVISTPAYLDLAAVSKTVPTPSTKVVNTLLALGVPGAGEKSYASTTTGIRFSPYVVEVDVCCVGAGGGGGGGACRVYYNKWENTAYEWYGGHGGYGGAVVNKLGRVPDVHAAYDAIVGAGGKGGFGRSNDSPASQIPNFGYGSTGGKSTFMATEAAGGSGGGGGTVTTDAGSGAMSGGSQTLTAATAGANGIGRAFGEAGGTLYGGGGGGSGIDFGSGAPQMRNGGAGGTPYGGAGATGIDTEWYPNRASAGSPGQGAGGGGGGGFNSLLASAIVGGTGGNGLVRIRWRVAT